MSDILKVQAKPQVIGTLTGLLLALMACQTSWSKKAQNSRVKWRFPLKKDQRNTQVTLRLTRSGLDPNIFLHTCFRTSSRMSSLDFLKPRRKMVQHCSAWWANVFKSLVPPSGPTLWANNAPTLRTSRRKTSTSVSEITLMQLPGSWTLATNWFVGFVSLRSPHSCQCMSLCSVKCSSSASLMEVFSV